MKILALICVCTLLTCALGGSENLSAAELAVGDKAPDFKLMGSDGKAYQLKDFTGKKVVVVAWFPKAFTGG